MRSGTVQASNANRRSSSRLADAAEAATAIDRGDGTVWAADAREGFHGGAHQTYWVNDDASA